MYHHFYRGSYAIVFKIPQKTKFKHIAKNTILTFLAIGFLQSCSNHKQPEFNPDLFRGHFNHFSQTSGKVVGTYIGPATLRTEVDAAMFPAHSLTHLMYSFITLCGPGQLANVDEICQNQPDFTLATNSTSPDIQTVPLLQKLKNRNPKLKIIASIGGGMGSKPFFPLAKSKRTRAIFIQSMMTYLQQQPVFDGVDVDWEHPKTKEQGQQYLLLMSEIRTALNQLTKQTGQTYQLTTAVSGSEWAVKHIPYGEVSNYLDYIFAMTYDGAGPWANRTGHHASIYSAAYQPHSLDNSISNLITAGVPANKLVAGAASYSRGWTKIKNIKDNNPFTGIGKYMTSQEFGNIQYKSAVAQNINSSNGKGLNGFEVVYDNKLDAYYLWEPDSHTMIGYDDPRAIIRKAEYVLHNKLAGLFYWNFGGDNGDVLNAINHGLQNQKQEEHMQVVCTHVPNIDSKWYVKANKVYLNNSIDSIVQASCKG